jgi:hypothetical protein
MNWKFEPLKQVVMTLIFIFVYEKNSNERRGIKLCMYPISFLKKILTCIFMGHVRVI